MNIAPDTFISDIAANFPSTIPTFERLGIDYCCGGRVPLGDACRDRAIDAAPVIAELATVAGSRDAWPAGIWATEPLPALIEHIVTSYHEPLRRDLDVIERLMTKVLLRHGQTFPDMLPPLADVCQDLSRELLSHTADEELVCFPHIAGLTEGRVSASLDMRTMLPKLTREHLKAGAALRQIRELTSDFHAPEGACVSFRALFALLADLERQLHRHVHLENNILFPRAAAAEAELARQGER
jgi:regulator of cell morphogenesis and NO signaling